VHDPITVRASRPDSLRTLHDMRTENRPVLKQQAMPVPAVIVPENTNAENSTKQDVLHDLPPRQTNQFGPSTHATLATATSTPYFPPPRMRCGTHGYPVSAQFVCPICMENFSSLTTTDIRHTYRTPPSTTTTTTTNHTHTHDPLSTDYLRLTCKHSSDQEGSEEVLSIQSNRIDVGKCTT